MLLGLKNTIKKIPFAVPIVRGVKQKIRRIHSRLRKEVPLPSPQLIYLVAGTEDPEWFLRSGALGAQCLVDTLARQGVQLASFSHILDFGCGVGRVLRHFNTFKGTRFYGTDYNHMLIESCQQNLKFAEFQVNTLDGRLTYPDKMFDLVYALSVFTHLSEKLQFFWLEELTRITKPGGYLFITLHGDFYFDRMLPEEQLLYQNGKLAVRDANVEGSNECAAFHPKAYVEHYMTKNLELVEHIPEGALGNPRQDAYLFRKPL